jgi:hypothetical protein
MEFYKLPEAIEVYCDTNDIIFIYGSEELQQVHLGSHVALRGVLDPNQLVLFAGFSDQPEIINGSTVAVTYSGFLSLGRHCEDDTSSSQDETQKQKYDRRLGVLKQSLANVITGVACANDIVVGAGINFRELTNQFNYNLDLIQTPITFSH